MARDTFTVISAAKSQLGLGLAASVQVILAALGAYASIFLCILFPDLVLPAVAAPSSSFTVNANNTIIPNQFIVTFTKHFNASRIITSTSANTTNITTTLKDGNDRESAERTILESILHEATQSSACNSKCAILDKLSFVDDTRMWVVEGPSDLDRRVNEDCYSEFERDGGGKEKRAVEGEGEGPAGCRVAIVEPNMVVELQGGFPKRNMRWDTEAEERMRMRRANSGDWGLKKIAQSDKYLFPSNGGRNVDVYIVDGGVDIDHPEFEGRATNGASFVDGGSFRDGRGHGTHLAGIVGSKTWGVAPNVNLISVRVFNSHGRASTHNVAQGLQWILNRIHHQSVQRTPRKSIINLSFGIDHTSPGIYPILIHSATHKNVPVVVAAGNQNIDACRVSPARVEEAITVGSVDVWDDVAWNSNWGRCLDIMAPGVSIQSTWPRDKVGWVPTETETTTQSTTPVVAGNKPKKAARMSSISNTSDQRRPETPDKTTPAHPNPHTGTMIMSGTSMSAAFVSGALALFLGERDFSSVQELKTYMLRVAQWGVIKKKKARTVDAILFNGRRRECVEIPCVGLADG
ncbi:serine protease [Quaeritorhiza haematococci]|nr:serine protease [Quaeritorhiza haematococci]